MQVREEFEVLPDGKIQVLTESLRHVGDAIAQARIRGIHFQDGDAASGWFELADHQAQQGALSRPVCADHSKHFSLPDDKVEAVKHGRFTIVEAQPLGANDWCAHLSVANRTSAGIPTFSCPSALSTSTLTR